MAHLALIDAGSITYRFWHGYGPEEPLKAVCSYLDALRAESVDYLAVAVDHPGRTFRSDILAAYKANRPQKPPEVARFIADVKRAVAAFGIPILHWPEHEADDAIASATDAATRAGLSVSIVSNDKDMMQLVQPGVTMLARSGGQTIRYDADAVVRKTGVRPQQIPDWLAIAGDAADNIPGVIGLGPAKARDLLKAFGSVEALLAMPLDAIRAIPRIRKIAEAVHAAADEVKTYLRLATLDRGWQVDLAALKPGPLDRWALAGFLEPVHPDLLRRIRDRGRR